MNRIRGVKACLLLAALLTFTASTARAGELHLRVLDDSLGIQVPARVLLRGPDGVCRVPEGAPLLKVARDVWFVTEGSYMVDLPPGRAELRVERGKEYIREKEYLDIPSEGTLQKEVRLKRWIDMRASGYQSLENNLHLAPEIAGACCAAEDLDFGTVLQWWNRPVFGVPQGSGHIRKPVFGGMVVPTTIYDVEVEYEWGAIYMLGLPNPFPFLNEPSAPNLPAARYGRQRGTLTATREAGRERFWWTHFWAWWMWSISVTITLPCTAFCRGASIRTCSRWRGSRFTLIPRKACCE